MEPGWSATVFLNFSGAHESILPAYVAWRAKGGILEQSMGG